MRKTIIFLLLLFMLVFAGCNRDGSKDSLGPETSRDQQTMKPVLKGILVANPPYVTKRLVDSVINDGIIESNGARLIHQAQISYAPNKVLELEFYCIYQADGIHIQNIYAKSNMSKKNVEILDFQKHGIVSGDLNLSMQTYRTLEINMKNFFTAQNLHEFVDLDQYPNEKEEIINNHPKLPDITQASQIIVGHRKMEPEDAQALIEIYQNIKEADFFDNREDGLPMVNAATRIYVYIQDEIYLYQPLVSGGIYIDGSYYDFSSNAALDILEKYALLEMIRY